MIDITAMDILIYSGIAYLNLSILMTMIDEVKAYISKRAWQKQMATWDDKVSQVTVEPTPVAADTLDTVEVTTTKKSKKING